MDTKITFLQQLTFEKSQKKVDILHDPGMTHIFPSYSSRECHEQLSRGCYKVDCDLMSVILTVNQPASQILIHMVSLFVKKEIFSV